MPHSYNQPEHIRQKGQRRATRRSQEVRGIKKQERIQQVHQLHTKGLKAQTIADQMDVNVKTVYRALQTLRERGVILEGD